MYVWMILQTNESVQQFVLLFLMHHDCFNIVHSVYLCMLCGHTCLIWKYTVCHCHCHIARTECWACGQVDRSLDSRSEGLGFDSQCWPCVEMSSKVCIPHCLGPPSRNEYQVHRSKVGSIAAGCCVPSARGSKVWRTNLFWKIYGWFFGVYISKGLLHGY